MKKNKIIISVVATTLIIISSVVAVLAAGSSGTLPFYDHGKNVLNIPLLSAGPKFGRVDRDSSLYMGDYRYPTIFEGSFGKNNYSSLNQTFNSYLGSTYAYENQSYYHLVPVTNDTARNVIDASKITPSVLTNVYGGNGDWIYGNIKPLVISNIINGGKYGQYYYIGDIAKYTGGIADNAETETEFSKVNPTALRFVKTSWPDINVFAVNEKIANVGQPLTFKLSGFEYVSLNRTKVYYSLTIKKDGKTVKTIEGSTNSDKSKKNVVKPKESEAGQFTVDKITGFIPNEKGVYTIELRVSDEVERYKTKTIQLDVNNQAIPDIPEDGGEFELPPNHPPTTSIYTEPFFYWPETVNFSTISNDPDGDEITEDIYVDGAPSGLSWNSSRVTSKTTHNATVVVVDPRGESAEASTTFDILPTTPTAEATVTGTLKVNRAIVLDAKASNNISPIQVAPIDYKLTEWKINPISEGLSGEDIKIRASSDKSMQQVLFKKAGTYELLLTVTNIYNETSEVYRKELLVTPDENPVANFSVESSTYYRDVEDGNQVTIKLTDHSKSLDNDTISQRIWYVEFDSNNDGVFGTPEDGGKNVIDNTNKTSVTYKTKHVGHYRFSLEVKEAFGQDTYEEFILPAEYLRDSSDVLDGTGDVDTYLIPSNLNKAGFDMAVTVDNVPPIIDFGMKRKNQIELVLNFGGMDQATLQHQTGNRPGNGTNNGGGGGSYNHDYYTYDTEEKNALTTYAGTLEADLRAKGLDVKVVIDNSYYKVLDEDGTCIENIPVWGWVDYGSYTYSSYSGRSPYSGSWEVTSSSSRDVYNYQVVWCDSGVTSHAPPCQVASNAIYGDVYAYTEYTASLRQWVPDNRFVITNYVNEGCTYTESVDTTDFTSSIENYSYSDADYKYYYRMDNKKWTWATNTIKRNQVINTIQAQDIFLWNNSADSVRLDAQLLNLNSGKPGQYTQYNTMNLQSNIQQLRDYLINRFMIEEDPNSFTIVLGDEVDYTTMYEDFESDPELQREWKFVHDPTTVNGRMIDNQPASPITQSGVYISSPMQLNEVGTYTVSLRAKDNPLSDVGNDRRFVEYQKWSDEEIVREYKIHVHRRPLADFIATVEPGSLKLALDPSKSFDPDHVNNWAELGIAERGIVEYSWESYVVDGVQYNGAPPETLLPAKDYYITLRVKDIDGAYGTVTKLVSTKEVNLKPVALFDAPSVVLNTSELNNPSTLYYIRDRSYDPNGDDLTNYQWTIKRQSDGEIVWTGSAVPSTFDSIGLGKGKYILGLTVEDIPKYLPLLKSDLYEQEIEVIENNPPKSCFELSRSSITADNVTCGNGETSPNTLWLNSPVIYTDKSSDPDNDPFKIKSWRVEKLDAAEGEEHIWNVGSAPVDFNQFGGEGKYKVTQTVFDEPPSPLPSLSDEYVRYFNVELGPQNPYAVFEYSPLSPIAGDTINLIDKSFDNDGNITAWEWTIVAPNGTSTVQTTKNPKIINAVEGTYKVTLNVWDGTTPSKLKSKIPISKEIVVSKKILKAPTAIFVWEPYTPFLGETIKLDSSASFDVDGTIASYSWSIKSKEGTITTSTSKNPSIVANSQYYDVTLTVKDNEGLTHSTQARIEVDIAGLEPFVKHTADWEAHWINEGYDADVNNFLAGEKFVIELRTTPANKVEGSINFGGSVGSVDIPSSSFKLVSTSQFEYVWQTTLWRKDFKNISSGGYLFKFKGYYPVNNPTITSEGVYLINIVGNIYEPLGFHRNY